MNSRPITVVPSDLNDLEPLMPNHLLLLKSEIPLPPGLFRKEDLLSRRRWRQVQYHFLEEVQQGVSPSFVAQAKWVHPQRNLAVGDVVLVASETSHRSLWPLGRIYRKSFPTREVSCRTG